MKKENKMSTSSKLYIVSALIWLVIAGINVAHKQPVYVCINIVMVALCLFFAKRKKDSV